jgi:hypothetical protein
MVTVIPCTGNRCSIEFSLGGVFTVHDIPTQIVQDYVLRALKFALNRFARLTLEDLDRNPRCPKVWDRVSYGHAFQYGISRMDCWDAARFANHIKMHEDMLLKMLPHPSSPRYRKLSQLAFDIIIICTQNINEL